MTSPFIERLRRAENRPLIQCMRVMYPVVVIVGPTASGKSDLALRFLALPGDGEYLPLLVAYDQVFVAPNGNDELIGGLGADNLYGNAATIQPRIRSP